MWFKEEEAIQNQVKKLEESESVNLVIENKYFN